MLAGLGGDDDDDLKGDDSSGGDDMSEFGGGNFGSMGSGESVITSDSRGAMEVKPPILMTD